jgi:acyl-CoA synthetase (AMP-forming)/AMP-acid ligase II
MSVKNIRARLAADPEVGAGNVLTSRMRYAVGVDVPLVSFDTEVDGHPAREPFTLDGLDRAVRARATELHGLGLRPRDPVAVYVSNAADAVLSFFALARLGAIPALVNPNLDAERAALFISRLSAVGLLTDEAHRSRLAGIDFGTALLPDVAALDARPGRDHAFLRHDRNAEGRRALTFEPLRRDPLPPLAAATSGL